MYGDNIENDMVRHNLPDEPDKEEVRMTCGEHFWIALEDSEENLDIPDCPECNFVGYRA